VTSLTRGDNAGGRIEEVETSPEAQYRMAQLTENTALRDALSAAVMAANSLGG
jgi:hypothetical protein